MKGVTQPAPLLAYEWGVLFHRTVFQFWNDFKPKSIFNAEFRIDGLPPSHTKHAPFICH